MKCVKTMQRLQLSSAEGFHAKDVHPVFETNSNDHWDNCLLLFVSIFLAKFGTQNPDTFQTME